MYKLNPIENLDNTLNRIMGQDNDQGTLYLQFQNQAYLFFVLVNIVQLYQTSMLQCFHNFDLIQDVFFLLILDGRYDFGGEKSMSGLFLASFYFAKLASSKFKVWLKKNECWLVHFIFLLLLTFPEIPVFQNHQQPICHGVFEYCVVQTAVQSLEFCYC
jgi:hypothetical protein